MDAPTLINGLLGLAPQVRESTSHLHLTRTPSPKVVVFTHGQDQPAAEGDLSTQASLVDQLSVLATSRLLGGLELEELTEPGQRTLRVQAWSTTAKERSTWLERMQLLGRYAPAAELLALAGAHRAAEARQVKAWEEVLAAVRRADDAGVPKVSIATLAATTRPTVLRAVQTEPAAPVVVDDPSDDGYWSKCAPAAAPAPTPAPIGPPAQGVHLQPREGASGTPTSGAARQTRARRAHSRFDAIAVVVDTDVLYLPDGTTHPWQARHLGDLAMLASTHRLGHGGGTYAPERGEIWLTAGALTRLGLPVDVDWDRVGTREERVSAMREVFDQVSTDPFVTEAVSAGWKVGVSDRFEPRTLLTHPEHLRAGAVINVLPWSEYRGIELLVKGMDGDDLEIPAEPAVLAQRLQEFCDHLGVSYRVSPGNTCLDLVDATRRPRDPDEPLGKNMAVKFQVPAELPGFKRPGGDTTGRYFPFIAQPISWWRSHESLNETERSMRYVHAYDHSAHFLGIWGSTHFGVEGLVHRTGDDARWDGTERAGYYLISGHEWANWTLFDPVEAGGVPLGDGRWWVTSHTLNHLRIMDPGLPADLGLTYEECWTWEHQIRYLDKAADRLSKARKNASGPVAGTVKALYAQGSGKFAEQGARSNYHLNRPDWRDHIYAASHTSIARTLMWMQDHEDWSRTSPFALAVATDAIFIASHEADPAKAWPGDPAKYQAVSGGWKPIGTALLEDWGPEYLPALGRGRRRAFPYAKALAAMSEPGWAVTPAREAEDEQQKEPS